MLGFFAKKAKALGFIGIGFSRPERPFYMDQFLEWIARRKNAGMSWLERNIEIREDPSRLLKGCRTIISLAYPYPSKKPATPDGFTVSRYSQPTEEDYHLRLKRLCRDLVHMIRDHYAGSDSRICVDSAPLLEKSYGCSAGIGFIGKNNMLIIPGYGSYFCLAEILTTAPMAFSPAESMEHQCASCTLCIDSCPTGALEKPFYLDASRCLSYLTIEYQGALSGETGRKMGDCFFGCDRCQEVCPFNEAEDSRGISLPSTDEFLSMAEESFKKRFGKTAFARSGRAKLRTNIKAIKSQGKTAFLPKLKAS
jgi:epoxyqueuosine reductase